MLTQKRFTLMLSIGLCCLKLKRKCHDRKYAKGNFIPTFPFVVSSLICYEMFVKFHCCMSFVSSLVGDVLDL